MQIYITDPKHPHRFATKPAWDAEMNGKWLFWHDEETKPGGRNLEKYPMTVLTGYVQARPYFGVELTVEGAQTVYLTEEAIDLIEKDDSTGDYRIASPNPWRTR